MFVGTRRVRWREEEESAEPEPEPEEDEPPGPVMLVSEVMMEGLAAASEAKRLAEGCWASASASEVADAVCWERRRRRGGRMWVRRGWVRRVGGRVIL